MMVLGAVTNYTYDQIEPWINSLKATGFKGTIALIAYYMRAADVKKLEEAGVTIFAFSKDEEGNLIYPGSKDFNIVVERFIHAWYFLGQIAESDRPEHVLLTDVRDVIFQTNPEKDTYIDLDYIRVASENIKYKDEPWSRNNLEHAFGPLMSKVMDDAPIICAGVIEGSFEVLRDLCLEVYLLCRGSMAHVPGGGGPDQAALNIILNQNVWKAITLVSYYWTVHLGTTSYAIESGSGDIGYAYKHGHLKSYRDLFIDPEGIEIDGDGIVKNDAGTPFFIVHQYNRVDGLEDQIKMRYKS